MATIEKIEKDILRTKEKIAIPLKLVFAYI